jgi:NAD(P)-dependent dehydrogenase (short-subunit alcohol dehydrogenase family)
MEAMAPYQLQGMCSPDAYEQSLPLHRLGTATEAGAAAVFLMTNGFMNGATLNIDGGARLV